MLIRSQNSSWEYKRRLILSQVINTVVLEEHFFLLRFRVNPDPIRNPKRLIRQHRKYLVEVLFFNLFYEKVSSGKRNHVQGLYPDTLYLRPTKHVCQRKSYNSCHVADIQVDF